MYGDGGPPGHQGKAPSEVCVVLELGQRRRAAGRRAIWGSRTRIRSSPPRPPRAAARQGVSSSAILRLGSAASQGSKRVSRSASWLRQPRHRRVVVVEAGQDAGGEEPVERLLGALVGIADQIRQRPQHRGEQLRVESHHQLVVDQARIVGGVGQIGEAQLAPLLALESGEPRLGQVESAGQQRQRPQLAVRQLARPGHGAHRHLTDPERRDELELELRRRRPARPRRAPPRPPRDPARTPPADSARSPGRVARTRDCPPAAPRRRC